MFDRVLNTPVLTIGKDIPESVVGTHKLHILDDVAVGISSEGCCKNDRLRSILLLLFRSRLGLKIFSL